VHINTLSVQALTSDVLINNHTLSDVSICRGALTDMSSIEVDDLIVKRTASSSSSSEGGGSERGLSIVVADANGRISRLGGSELTSRDILVPVTLSSLTIDQLSFQPLMLDHHHLDLNSRSVIDFGGRVLRNVKVEERSFEIVKEAPATSGMVELLSMHHPQ